jgi:hypothetical protein
METWDYSLRHIMTALNVSTYNSTSLTVVWEFEYGTCSFVVQHWWWAVHIWDIICILWVLGYIAQPLWWIHWQRKGRPIISFALLRVSKFVEGQLEKWGLITRGQRRGADQAGRKKM